MLKKEIKITFTHTHLVISFVIMAHILIPSAISSLQSTTKDRLSKDNSIVYTEIELDQHIQSIDKNKTVKRNQEKRSLISLNPDIIIYNRLEQLPDKMVDLFDIFSGPTVKMSSLKEERVTKSKRSIRNFSTHTTRISKEAALPYTKLTKKQIINNEKKKLKKGLASLNPKFQKCYEEQLINDELLTGKINILLKHHKSVIQFNGVGKKSSIISLKRCIKNLTKRIYVHRILASKSIKFSIML